MRNLTAEEAKAVIKEFNRNAIKYEFYEVSPKVLEIAENLVNKYGVEGLRSLDSIQLATAVLLKNDVDIFKTSDKLLEKLMLAEGLTTDI